MSIIERRTEPTASVTSTPAPAAGPRLSPERILQALSAHQLTHAMRAAIELDLFTAIGEGIDRVADLAPRISASVRGTRALCDFLTIHGFLSKTGDRYTLSPESALFLDRRSPASVASTIQFLGGDDILDSFRDLTETVRRGGPRREHDSTTTENPVWVSFARGMGVLQVPAAEFIAGLMEAPAGRPCKVLDIAAGHGVFGLTIARRNPEARITALDWAPVLEVAKENARRFGVADRYSTIAGSAFEVDCGGDYDVVLLTNFLHHFEPAVNEALLRRVHAALKGDGVAMTLEFVPNEDRISPEWAAAFSLVMLACTAHGDAYTFSELETMLRSAGFTHTSRHALPEMPGTVLVSKKS